MKSNELMKQSLPNGPTSLWFNKDDFMKDHFNVEHFIVECRRHVTLDVLRNDLHLYLKILQSAMIELINKDYADFLNLSTNLVGMDKAINHLIQPLNGIKMEILSVKKDMMDTINTIEEKIKWRIIIREKKEQLLYMIKIIQSLQEMENLLGISNENDGSRKNIFYESSNNQLIERVASEFNRLQFQLNRSKELPFVAQIKPRVKVIADTLVFSLEASLKECFMGMDGCDLISCLRTYASIDKADQAHALFRRLIVQDYMQEVINEQSEKEMGLTLMFDKVLDFIPSYCTNVKDATSGSANAVLGYDFIVNAVWPEIVTNLEFRLPFLFAPGDPELFHERYVASMAFLDKFESQLSSQASVKRFRQHPSYNLFISKWSISVYFQIRYQDIAGQLEVALYEPIVSTPTIDPKQGLAMTSSQALCKCLRKCWLPNVYLDILLHRFWKLSLQLISRYGIWINDILQKFSSNSTIIQRVESVSSLQLFHKQESSNIPPTTSSPSLQSLASQQQSNFFKNTEEYVVILCDIRKLTVELQEIFLSNIYPLISKCEGINMELVEGAWRDAQNMLAHYVPELLHRISNDIAMTCSSHLKHVSNIPRLYKRTNRENPSKPSPHMQNLLKPLTDFFEKQSGVIEEDRKSLINNAAQITGEQFYSVIAEVLTSARRMEESLRRLKASRGTLTDAVNQGISDDEKIRLQLAFDVREYIFQINKLGVEEPDVPSLEKLKDIVKPLP